MMYSFNSFKIFYYIRIIEMSKIIFKIFWFWFKSGWTLNIACFVEKYELDYFRIFFKTWNSGAIKKLFIDSASFFAIREKNKKFSIEIENYRCLNEN